MATTALKIDGKNLLFMTVQVPNGGVDVDIFTADEEYMAFGTPSLGISAMNEEEYHVNLRKQSQEKGQFVPEFSTNPEWNPLAPET